MLVLIFKVGVRMKKILFSLLFILPFSLSAKYKFDETVFIQLEQSEVWKKAKETSSEQGSCLTRYILDSENEINASKILTIQFKDKQIVQVRTAQEAMAREQQMSPQAQWKIIRSQPNDILYERTFPTGEHEIVRMVMTKKGLHRAAFLKRGPLEEDERASWTQRLMNGVVGR